MEAMVLCTFRPAYSSWAVVILELRNMSGIFRL